MTAECPHFPPTAVSHFWGALQDNPHHEETWGRDGTFTVIWPVGEEDAKISVSTLSVLYGSCRLADFPANCEIGLPASKLQLCCLYEKVRSPFPPQRVPRLTLCFRTEGKRTDTEGKSRRLAAAL
jgi:hypothetical protein